MATLWVRYDDGDEASWPLTDALAANLQDFVSKMIHAGFERDLFSFPVVSDKGAPGLDYCFVSLRMDHVVAWHVDGLVNETVAAALWAEMNPPK